MSKSDEFSHGTDHRFGVTKEYPGSYKSCCGMGIDKSGLGGWNVTMPGESQPDEWTNTLRDAKWMAESHHKQGYL